MIAESGPAVPLWGYLPLRGNHRRDVARAAPGRSTRPGRGPPQRARPHAGARGVSPPPRPGRPWLGRTGPSRHSSSSSLVSPSDITSARPSQWAAYAESWPLCRRPTPGPPCGPTPPDRAGRLVRPRPPRTRLGRLGATSATHRGDSSSSGSSSPQRRSPSPSAESRASRSSSACTRARRRRRARRRPETSSRRTRPAPTTSRSRSPARTWPTRLPSRPATTATQDLAKVPGVTSVTLAVPRPRGLQTPSRRRSSGAAPPVGRSSRSRRSPGGTRPRSSARPPMRPRSTLDAVVAAFPGATGSVSGRGLSSTPSPTRSRPAGR